MTDKHVQFCTECKPGYRCKICDETFINKGKLHTTSFHQIETDITAHVVDNSTNMIVDIGSPKTVIGEKDEKRFIEKLSHVQQENLEIQEVDENFKFGPSGPYRCSRRLKFPIETDSTHITAEVAIVKADIPMLLGNNVLKPMEAEIKLLSSGNGLLKLKEAVLDLKETPGRHYTIGVEDLGNLSDNVVYLSLNVTCEVCETTFKTEANLQNHKATQHRMNHPLSCEVCEQNFKTKVDLKKHETTQHGRNQPFSCDICRNTFNSEVDFEKHEPTKHSKKQLYLMFNCKGCGFKAKNEMELERHILEYHWNKQYRCEKCDFPTYSVNDFNVHIETAHVLTSNKTLKSILKNNNVKPEDDVDLEHTMNDLNTLLNGSKSRKQSKPISAVRNLVKMNQKQNVEIIKDEKNHEENCEVTQEDNLNSIFLSHHTDEEDDDEVHIDEKILNIFFSEDDDQRELTENEKKEVLKLHKYFAHRSGRKLWENLFQPAEKLKGKKRMILEFLNQCEVCSKYKKTPGRPRVAMAKSKDVNEIVGMDLKILKKSGKKEIGILYLKKPPENMPTRLKPSKSGWPSSRQLNPLPILSPPSPSPPRRSRIGTLKPPRYLKWMPMYNS